MKESLSLQEIHKWCEYYINNIPLSLSVSAMIEHLNLLCYCGCYQTVEQKLSDYVKLLKAVEHHQNFSFVERQLINIATKPKTREAYNDILLKQLQGYKSLKTLVDYNITNLTNPL